MTPAWKAGLLAGALFLIGAATGGAIVGALAGGIWGGLLGFGTFLLAAALAVVLLFVGSAAVSGAGLGPGQAAVVLTMGVIGAWLGVELGRSLGSGAWQPIWAGSGAIAIGALGGATGVFLGMRFRRGPR